MGVLGELDHSLRRQEMGLGPPPWRPLSPHPISPQEELIHHSLIIITIYLSFRNLKLEKNVSVLKGSIFFNMTSLVVDLVVLTEFLLD